MLLQKNYQSEDSYGHSLAFLLGQSSCSRSSCLAYASDRVTLPQVMQAAANIRALRPPSAYKGKGIRYTDEVVKLKTGKKK